MESSSSKPNVLVTEPSFSKSALDLLKTKCTLHLASAALLSRQQLMEAVAGKDAVIVYPLIRVDAAFLDAAGPNLKYVSTYSVGYDHIDLVECKKRNVLVGHTPDVLTSCVAELAFALMLAAARRVVETTNELKGGKWLKLFHTQWMFGVDIAESVVGIVGFGRIGQAVAKRLQGFEVEKIVYHDEKDVPAANELKAQRVPFKELLQQSDFVIVCTRLSPQTERMFDEEAFSQMKRNAIFVNISRGTVVKQDALVSALASGQIRAAGLDVMEVEPIPANDPILKLDNCVLSPHNGTATHACRDKMAILAVRNILEAIDGKQMPGQIKLRT